MSSWQRLDPRVKGMATFEAKETEPFLSRENDERSVPDRIMYLYVGFVGEIVYHDARGTLGWWVKYRKLMRGKRSDLGFDAPGSVNVKTVPAGSGFVIVNDERAEKYIVFELHPIKGTREVGSFSRMDIHWIMLPNGLFKRGVEMECVK